MYSERNNNSAYERERFQRLINLCESFSPVQVNHRVIMGNSEIISDMILFSDVEVNDTDLSYHIIMEISTLVWK